jgi:hypothetical protein
MMPIWTSHNMRVRPANNAFLAWMREAIVVRSVARRVVTDCDGGGLQGLVSRDGRIIQGAPVR